MPEKPKVLSRVEKITEDTCEVNESAWSEDQKNREYYYDDSHGYEVFDPEDPDEDVDETSGR